MKNKYHYTFLLGVKESIEYRLDFFIKLISSVFPIIIHVFLWKTIFSASNKDVMFGYSFKQLILYTILASIVTKLIATNFEGIISQEIKLGGLNQYLVKPMNYFSYKFFHYLGEKSVVYIMITVIILFILINLFIFYEITFSIYQLLFFLLSLIFSILIKFLLSFALSQLTFWLLEVTGIFNIVRVLMIIVSGGMFPVTVFKGTFLEIIQYLPFKFLVFFPVNILTGKITMTEIYNGLISQMFWILVFSLLAYVVWKRGIKKYVAVGG